MKIKEEKREPLLEQFMFAQKIHEIQKYLEDNKMKVTSLLEPSLYDELSVKTLYYNILETPEKYFEKEQSELIKTKIKTEFTEGQKEFKLIICQDNGLNKLKQSLQLFSSYLQKYVSENLEIKVECISSPIYSIKLKYINLQDNFFTNVFSDFEVILQENNIKAILNELELKTHKEKKLMFVV
jgi:translation initiation factor 2 alpha subunit (eIF-2alpha)